MENIARMIYYSSFRKEILTKNQLYIIIGILIENNLLDCFIKQIKFVDKVDFCCRYNVNQNLFLINYDLLKKIIPKKVMTCSSYYFLDINLRIVQILQHELVHVIQENECRPVIVESVKLENLLKQSSRYSREYYLSNPVEREAEIIAYNEIKKIILEIDIPNISKLYSYYQLVIECYGYYANLYQCSLNFFFSSNYDGNKRYPNEQSIIIGDYISKSEYDNLLEKKLETLDDLKSHSILP